MEDRLRQIAGEFLARSDSLCFIGYEAAPAGAGVRPAIVREPSGVDRLVWNRYCYPNLALYLPRFAEEEGIVGIALKGCDARAVRELIRARQIDRRRLFAVGLPCTGLAGPDGDSVAQRCSGCQYPDGFDHDAALGPMESPALPEAPDPCQELARLGARERQEFWLRELDKCIRCNACRQICYACFCPECIFDSSRPRWHSKAGRPAEKLFFHAVRAYHLAGRCIGCGECMRACPAGVRLDLLYQSMKNHLEEIFSFPGAGLALEPPLETFSREDPDPMTAGRR